MPLKKIGSHCYFLIIFIIFGTNIFPMDTGNGMNNKKWLILTIAFAICLTSFILPQLIFYPWRTVPNLLGDGGKNTFTYAYHVLYDKGVWFTGMNYPYGEHIVFADGQPLLSIPLGYLHASLETAFAVMGWLTALSYVLAIVYTYKTLISFSVKPAIAMLFGALIAVFTPQLSGIPGHYALAYSCIIPMLFYWTIQYDRSRKWEHPAYIFILGLLFSFLHPYYAALTFVWVAAYATGHLIFSKGNARMRLTHSGQILISPVLIFAIVGIFMKATDPYRDRPTTPFSNTENYTSPAKILTSPFSPIWTTLKEKKLFTAVNENADGGSYIGIAVMLILTIAIITGIARIMSRQRTSPELQFPNIWLFMAFAILLFSMGVPFVWHMEWLLDYIPFFKQFRTVARFSWIFYYIISIYAAFLISSWFAALLQRRKVLAYVVLMLPGTLWIYEANAFTGFIRKLLYNGADNYNILSARQDVAWETFLSTHNHYPADFQTVLVLPYFAIGSEKIWIDGNVFGVTQAAIASIQLHLPTIDAMMSRTSWSAVEKQVTLVAGPYAHKSMLDDIKDSRPFLLIDMGLDTTDVDQRYLLAASDYIGRYSNCTVYACYPERIKSNDKLYQARVAATLPYLKTGDTCLNSTASWSAVHFSTPVNNALFGTQAMPIDQQRDNIIATMPVKSSDGNLMYEFSCWSLVSKEDFKTPGYLLTFYDSTGHPIDTRYVMTKNSTDNLGLWFRAGQYFVMPANCRKVTCSVDKSATEYKVLDELLIRPADALIISKDATGRVMADGHLLTGVQ